MDPQHKASLLRLVDNLVNAKNRNSRALGAQFRGTPDRSTYPDYYTHVREPRTLDTVKAGIQIDRYPDPQAVYYELQQVFKLVIDNVLKSSIVNRDANKMLGFIDEYWEADKVLPALDGMSVDPSSRPRRDYDSADTPGLVSEPASARPSPGPSAYGLDMGNRSFTGPSVVPSSHFRVPSASNVPVGNMAAGFSSSTGGAFVMPVTSGAPIQPNVLHIPAFTLSHKLEPNMEMPTQLPTSTVTKEARQKLQEAQDKMLASRARQNQTGSRKRKRQDKSQTDGGWDGYLDSKRAGGEQRQFYIQCLAYMKSLKDPASGRMLSASLNALPSAEKFPQFYQHIRDPHPPTFMSVEKHIRTNLVPDPSDFDAEMVTIFANGRLWPSVGLNSSDGEALPGFYGDVLSLQRIYNELSTGSGHIPSEDLTAASLTAVPYGPGSIPLQRSDGPAGKLRYVSSMENKRFAASEKTVLPIIEYKGEDYEAGDFVHLYNPSNPRLPIIGQIFSTFKLHKLHHQPRHVTVNWYYRPCQTLHLAARTFYEQEVFKTLVYVDHPIEDILERVCVMPIADYVRGRYDYWNEEMPLFVVEHRWDIETGTYRKIKQWKRCIPENTLIGGSRLRAFLDPMPLPPRLKSPFLRQGNISGPGQLADPLESESEEQDDCYTQASQWPEGAGQVAGWGRYTSHKRLAEAVLKPEDYEEDAASRQVPSADQVVEEEEAYEAPKTLLEQQAAFEAFAPLSRDLAIQLRTDEDQVLWFGAAPIERTSVPIKHSLEYLAHTAEQLGY